MLAACAMAAAGARGEHAHMCAGATRAQSKAKASYVARNGASTALGETSGKHNGSSSGGGIVSESVAASGISEKYQRHGGGSSMLRSYSLWAMAMKLARSC